MKTNFNFKVIKNKTPISKISVTGYVIYNDFMNKFYAVIKNKKYLINNQEIKNSDGFITLYSHPNNDYYDEDNIHSREINMDIGIKKLEIIRKYWSKFYNGQKILSYKIVDKEIIILKAEK